MRLFNKWREYKKTELSVYILSLMIFFWILFDSTITYLTPLILSSKGFSNTLVGAIISVSSVAGLLLDFFIYRVFKTSNYIRSFSLMFLIGLFYPLVLVSANSVAFFLFAMALWGLYFDLYGFGLFDFVGRFIRKDENSFAFGVVSVFRTLGLFIGPIIVGLFIGDKINLRSIYFVWAYFLISVTFFIILISLRNRRKKDFYKKKFRRVRKLFFEFNIFKKLSRKMISPLMITFFLFTVEAFFWTLAPLSSTVFGLRNFGALFLAAYTLPPILLGWFVGRFTKVFGKKRTAIYSIMIGSAGLFLMTYLSNPILILITTFFASCFFGLSLPSISGAYADYISEATYFEEEIEALEDSFCNLGYIVGPVSAGILADFMGLFGAFRILGIVGIILSLVLIKVTPRKIQIKV